MIEKLDSTLTAAKIAMAATLGAVGAFFGWRMIALFVLAFLMFVDYLSGSWAARLSGTWKSEMARQGIGHKGGMVLVVAVCGVADFIMLTISQQTYDIFHMEWPVVLYPIICVWYIITEIGSIIENAIKMGAPIPAWLPKVLDATLKTVDTVGEAAVGGDKKNE